jgi:hypothetical protein
MEGQVPEQSSSVIPPGIGLVDMSCSVQSMMYRRKAGDEFFPEMVHNVTNE